MILERQRADGNYSAKIQSALQYRPPKWHQKCPLNNWQKLFFYFIIIFLFKVDCSFSWLCPEKDNWVVVVNSVTLKTMSLWTVQPLTIRCCCWLTEFPLGKLITQIPHLEAHVIDAQRSTEGLVHTYMGISFSYAVRPFIRTKTDFKVTKNEAFLRNYS